MKLNLLHEIWIKLQQFFSWNKIYPLWRFILCFFSTDYFIRFNYEWITEIKKINLLDSRTIQILYFIGVFLLIRLIIYGILEIPLRLIFHGYVKKKVLNNRKKLDKASSWDKKRNLIGFVTLIAPRFQKYFFQYGLVSSNDFNEPLKLDAISKEKEFNEGMTMLYRWILTIIHTILVSIIVWKFYSIWFFIVIIVVLIISILLILLFIFVVLNLDYIESVRLQFLKENKKMWK